MRRLALAAATMTALGFCCTPPMSALAQIVVYPSGSVSCLPGWYPRGWELMIRDPCAAYYYGGYYHRPAYAPYRAAVASDRVHRRPYLRPGWWW